MGTQEAISVNIHRLRLFCAVAEAGSLKAAGQRLFITEAAVSHQIKSLEHELGTRLFERQARGVHLTQAGEAVYRQAGVALEAMENLLAVAHQQQDPLENVVVGVTHLGGLYHLADALRDFHRYHPHIGLDVVEIPSFEICARISRAEMSVGFVWGPVSTRLSIDTARFSVDQAVLVTSVSPPSSAPSTANSLVIVKSNESEHLPCCCDDQIERLVPSLDGIAQVRSVSSVDTAKKLAQAGLAVTVLPARTVLTEVRAGLLSTVSTDSPILQLTMIYAPDFAGSAAQQILIEFMLQRSPLMKP